MSSKLLTVVSHARILRVIKKYRLIDREIKSVDLKVKYSKKGEMRMK